MRNRPGGYSGYEIRWSGENTARGLGGAMTRVPPEPRISMPLDMHNQPQFVAFAQSRNEVGAIPYFFAFPSISTL